ncbi:glycoside hydrolase [Lobosporangium transversale]|uniref:Glycoside hydrolase n=1 Tax=Lobosporangium transversale TaxID=64571 RepID=A0A1Y2G762_9FUNG|nr:glycoside hydrolase [Lobosporangium transversale]ORY99667.1 glycoside hydrolase [Lobosporangium transversale]|eukprot:XP_021875931.1 glycoside hydrolase [Lobosporangium transversale]
MVSIPKSQPIKSLKELLAWQPGQDEYNVANTPLHLRPSPTLSASPYSDCRVIVCHDMAGGYAEDASPQGNSYSTLYSIQYWNHVDVFIYFSHSLITIPPVVWTNAAHRNGVRCLGTIITEWLPGVLVTDEMVSGPGQAFVDQEGNDIVDRRFFSRAYADKLVQLAVYFKFDGWFINIESILRGGNKQAEQMYAFLAYLRKRLHEAIPNGGELIWYDSVISSTGEVAWQDKLSSENYRFFEQSDGIFTNYTWKEGYVAESAALAGSRNRDVYTGIDIWGRNTFGGGGYTAYKALEVIQRDKTSCALFAPAWTYEFLDKKDFLTNDRLFWTGFHGDKDNKAFLPISAYIPARPSGCSSWFYSNFDRGFGHGFWVNGKVRI